MPADAESRLRAAVDVAVRSLGPLAELDVPLGPLTTYRVGGSAAVLVRATGRSDLVAAVEAAQASGLPILPVGRGSNMLVADAGFPGIAVSLVELPVAIDIATETSITTVSAGASLPVVARKTASAGLTGFEWAVGVPGSIGGAVRMNAGGHGSDMAASLVAATICDLAAGVTTERDLARLGLAYRHSALGSADVVVSARLELALGDRELSLIHI